MLRIRVLGRKQGGPGVLIMMAARGGLELFDGKVGRGEAGIESDSAAVDLLKETRCMFVDATVGEMAAAGYLDPEPDTPPLNGEPCWQREQRFGAMMAMMYLAEWLDRKTVALGWRAKVVEYGRGWQGFGAAWKIVWNSSDWNLSAVSESATAIWQVDNRVTLGNFRDRAAVDTIMAGWDEPRSPVYHNLEGLMRRIRAESSKGARHVQ